MTVHFLLHSVKTAWLATFLVWTYDLTHWLRRKGESRPPWSESSVCSLLSGVFADVALLFILFAISLLKCSPGFCIS